MLIKIKDPDHINSALLDRVYHELERQGYTVSDDSRDYVVWILGGKPRDITLLSLKYPSLEIAQVGL